MSNPSKRTGTDGENTVWAWLEEIWGKRPTVDRSGGHAPGRDFTGTPPYAIEVKRRAKLEIPAWSRYLQGLHGNQWILFALARDKRRKDAHPDMMIVNAELGRQLLKAWKFLNGGLPYDD